RANIAPGPELVQRQLRAERPNQVWVADISEFPTGEGKLHVAGIRYLGHRGIVGGPWAPNPTPTSSSPPSSWLWVVAPQTPPGSSITATTAAHDVLRSNMWDRRAEGVTAWPVHSDSVTSSRVPLIGRE